MNLSTFLSDLDATPGVIARDSPMSEGTVGLVTVFSGNVLYEVGAGATRQTEIDIYVHDYLGAGESAAFGPRKIDLFNLRLRDYIESHSDRHVIVSTTSDLEQAIVYRYPVAGGVERELLEWNGASFNVVSLPLQDASSNDVFFATKTTTRTFVGTENDVDDWNAATQEDAPYSFNATTGELTITEQGRYMLTFETGNQITNTSGGQRSEGAVRLYVNGSAEASAERRMYARESGGVGSTAATIIVEHTGTNIVINGTVQRTVGNTNFRLFAATMTCQKLI